MSRATPSVQPPPPLTQRRILALWWPLAASWLLMGLELPLFAMAVARLPGPEMHLAAHGAVVMPLSLIIEAPIIMLLAASTALCRDRVAHRLVHRVMMAAGGALTGVHALVAFTPLFDALARDLLGVPDDVLEPARLGLRVMLPWTWCIAYRRFHQGLLIRAGRSRPVALGTIVRLGANATVLVAGVAHGELPGILVGATGIAAGVLAEAVFVGACARGTVHALRRIEPDGDPLTLGAFLRFYVPLALSPVLSLTVPPLSAAALSRLPSPVPSLAAWPATFGFAFMVRAVSLAFNEVVVTLLHDRAAFVALRLFTHRLAAVTSSFLLVFAATPLSTVWFGRVSALSPELTTLCRVAIALAVLQPALTALENWFQGRLVVSGRTRAVTTGMAVFVGSAAALYAGAIAWAPTHGIYLAVLTLTSAALLKTIWLGLAARRLAPPPSPAGSSAA